ncbi:MAG: N-acetyltransferase, partial [Candidatus Bathyarchaeota archaeon]|nr:N-acetyltransferase [Candidatus Bathyarchaeota archaeon]
MTGFVSPKAQVKGYIEKSAVILGASFIGSRTLIGRVVIVGYPTGKTVKSCVSSRTFAIDGYDSFSRGTRIGDECLIRSGTTIYETALIGDRVRTGHSVLIREGSVVGEDTLIGSSSMLDGKVKIGKRVKIQSNAYLPHLSVIENDVFIAPNVCFTNDPYPQSRHLTGVLVEKNAIMCANSTILAGVKIGRSAVVGAGAV